MQSVSVVAILNMMLCFGKSSVHMCAVLQHAAGSDGSGSAGFSCCHHVSVVHFGSDLHLHLTLRLSPAPVALA